MDLLSGRYSTRASSFSSVGKLRRRPFLVIRVKSYLRSITDLLKNLIGPVLSHIIITADNCCLFAG